MQGLRQCPLQTSNFALQDSLHRGPHSRQTRSPCSRKASKAK
ncbi:MAG: hypothetical protein RI949_2239, partial [Pseudomonadota bacterium]